MIPVTQAAIDEYKNNPKQTIRITLKTVGGYQRQITEADVVANGLVVNRYSANGESIQIGTCVAAELTLRLENGDGRFNSINFEGAELTVRMGTSQDTSGLLIGKFTVIDAPRKLAIIELYALDHMIKLDKPVDMDVLSLPSSVMHIMAVCCNECGLAGISGPQGAFITDMPNHDYVVSSIDTVGTMTYRNIIQWCCQIMGACAYLDNNMNYEADYLRVTWYHKPEYPEGSTLVVPTITEADRYSSDFYENAISITGIAVSKGDTAAMVGTSGYVLTIADNPLIAVEDISTIANNLSERIGYECHPFEASCLPMPYLFPLDIVNFVYKGVTYDVAISEVTITASAPTGLKGTGKSATSQSYATLNPLSQSEIANIGTIISANQNAFSNVVVGSTTISADTETDTLTFVAGSNVTLSADASTDTITISATGGGGGGGVSDVVVDGSSVVSSGVATIPYGNTSGYGVVKVEPVNDPGSSATRISMKTTSGQGTSETQMVVPKLDSNNKILASYLPLATTSTAGAMSASDKTKLNALADSTLYGHTTGSSVSSNIVTVTASCDNGFFALESDRAIFLKITEAIPTASSVYLFFDATDPILLYNTSSSDLSVGLTYIIHYDGTKFIKDGVVMDVATTSVNGAMSASDKTKLNGIASGAEVNQNAFSKIAVGNTTIQADSKTDTLTLVAGTNVTLTPDATTDTVTITANVPVTDVQTESNGEATSVVSSGIATLPKANSTTYGTITLMPVAYSSGTGGYVLMNYNGGTVYVPSLGAGNGYVSDNHLPEASILNSGAFGRKGMAGFTRSTTDHNLGVIYYRQAGGGGADETTYVPVLTASDGTIDASQLPQASGSVFGAIKCAQYSGSPIERHLSITNSSNTYYAPVLDSNFEIYSGNLPWSLIKSYIYPVGSVYETTSSTADPNTLFGNTWQLLGQLVTDSDVELTTSDGNLFADGFGAIKQTYKWERIA